MIRKVLLFLLACVVIPPALVLSVVILACLPTHVTSAILVGVLVLGLVRVLNRSNPRVRRDTPAAVVVPSCFVSQRTFKEADLMRSFPDGGRGLAMTLIALGVLGDALMFRSAIGFGMSAWLLLALAVSCRGMLNATDPSHRLRLVPFVASFVFAALTSWRAAQPLQMMSMTIAFGSLALAAWPRPEGSLADATPGDYLRVLRDDLRIGVTLPPRVMRFFRSNDTSQGILKSNAAILRGILIAIPVLIVFTTLLANAEPAFARLVEMIVDLGAIATLVFHSAASLWIASAMILPFVMREVVVYVSPTPVDGPPSTGPMGSESRPGFAFGITEANVLLGTIGTLFIAYILVKAQTLFGDHARALAKAHITAAEYARTGFFELTTVAVLSMVLLLVCGTTVSRATESGRRMYRVLASILIGGVLLITLSAFQRMTLYTDMYGLTRMRIYVFFALSGLAISFLWLAFTIVTEQPRRFAFGALLMLYATALGLELVNVDAWVAISHLSRQVAARSRVADDETFLRGLNTSEFHDLGSDAVPTLVNGISRLPEERRILFTRLMVDPLRDPETDWRSWTWGRDRAQQASARLPRAPIMTVSPMMPADSMNAAQPDSTL